MGQKVNPHGLRVGIIKDWDSRWYAEKDFADNLVEDDKIRGFICAIRTDARYVEDWMYEAQAKPDDSGKYLNVLSVAVAPEYRGNHIGSDLLINLEKIAKKLGKGRSTIANWVRVLNLEPRVLEMAKEGKITEGHCKALLAITDPEKQYQTAINMLERGQTVRQIEKKAKIKETKEEQKRNHILYKSIEDTFQGFFGSKVKLDAGKRRGKIIIEYTSNDDLERILGLIK